MTGSITESHGCPLCTESYDDRMDLRVHLEVEHRKSEVVAYLMEFDAAVTDVSADREPPTVDEERSAPSA
ncbi:hypothetical protein [Natrinema salifodinae]|nr:hypothetical protein [Natrinema salifodinae]